MAMNSSGASAVQRHAPWPPSRRAYSAHASAAPTSIAGSRMPINVPDQLKLETPRLNTAIQPRKPAPQARPSVAPASVTRSSDTAGRVELRRATGAVKNVSIQCLIAA